METTIERRHDGHHMSMGGPDSFQTTNMGLAHDFWYIVVAVLGFRALIRLVNLYKARSRFVYILTPLTPFPYQHSTH